MPVDANAAVKPDASLAHADLAKEVRSDAETMDGASLARRVRELERMQGDVEPTSPYCDEIRAAMSKAETGIRERRSIATHLESCPVCEDFAEELERRPGELQALFPPPPEPLAAELLPPLPPPR